MAHMMEYECPHCGGMVAFDTASQKLKCPYCDTEFDVDAMQTLEHEMKEEKQDAFAWESAAGGEWTPEETSKMRVYICQSCSGEIVAEETEGAMSCPYCGNNVVVKEQFSGDLKPDYIIPFKLDKEAAKKKLKEHFTGKKLLPKAFQSENKLEEIKGMYVPFWLFDADAEGEVRYKGTRVQTWQDSNYVYTRTSFYDIVRGGNVSFARIPVDGSSKMPDDLMESIEPFDFSEAVPFKPAYMAGFLADRYDVTAEDSKERANARIRQSTLDVLDADITGGYATKSPIGSYVNLSNSSAKYALYPVWVMTTKWRDDVFLFAMNGQTGKMVGNLPMDKGLYWKHHIKWTVILAIIIFVIMMIAGMFI